MSFVSITFLIFFTIIFLVYLCIPNRSKWLLLVGASYAFYGYWDWRYLPLIFFSTLVDYYCAHQMGRYKGKKERKPFLWLSLAINLGVLFVFKYYDFVGANLNAFLGTNFELQYLLLPLGISFYTLQTLGYTFDVYLGKVKPERHFGYFCLYVNFFPQLVAGPIERSRTLLPQLKSLKLASIYEFRHGLLLIIWGFFLKLVIADNLTVFMDSVFFTNKVLPFWLYWFVGGLVYIKVYCDFMAYSEIARGLAMLFGVSLTLNFRRPLLATNLRSFWQRWHVSLTRWIGDYIQVPLLKKFRGKILGALVSVFTLCVIGLWHGASWNYILFGLFHGVLLAFWKPVANFFYSIVKFNISTRSWLGRGTLMFALMFSGPLFYITDTTVLGSVMRKMLSAGSSNISMSLSDIHGKYFLIQALFGFMILSLYSFMAEYRATELTIKLAESHSAYRWISALAILSLIFLLGNFTSESFIYFEF